MNKTMKACLTGVALLGIGAVINDLYGPIYDGEVATKTLAKASAPYFTGYVLESALPNGLEVSDFEDEEPEVVEEAMAEAQIAARGERFVGPANLEALNKSQKEEWCISTAECKEGYACGLPTTNEFTIEYTFKVRTSATVELPGPLQWSALVCASKVCIGDFSHQAQDFLHEVGKDPKITVNNRYVRCIDRIVEERWARRRIY